MNAIKNLEDLDLMFYGDENYQRSYREQASSVLAKVRSTLDASTKKTLALRRSWLSDTIATQGDDVTVLPNGLDRDPKFDMILAVDEILTWEADESMQRKIVSQLVGLLSPGGVMLISLRDFKNSGCHKRPLGDSIYSQLGRDRLVITEVNELDHSDKQRWQQKLHVVANDEQFRCLELGARRTLYFKQLARYCMDAGFGEFGTIKDGYWRNHLRRSPEHLLFARAKW